MLNDPPPRRKWHLNRWLIVLVVAALSWSGWRAYTFRDALAQAKAMEWEVQYTDPVEEIRKDWKAAFDKTTWTAGVTSLTIPTSDHFTRKAAIVHRLNPEKLSIYKAPDLHDLSLLKPLSKLSSVALEGCTHLTNTEALKNLSSLKFILISGCVELRNVNAITGLPAVQHVMLLDCKELANIDALAGLSLLQQVSLAGCTQITNVDALKSLSTLQNLNLYGCTGLTNVDALKGLLSLKKISLKGCTALTPESVAALKAALPNANIVWP